jgi:hypothetical protein
MKHALEGIEGIETIVEPPDFPQHGLPQPADNSQMGALFLIAKDGYAFSGDAGDQVVVDAPATSLGSHGYIATDPDLRALFIASGRGIKPGTILESVRVVDLAPTVASLLGLGLKNVEGEVLTQMLSAATLQGPSRHELVTASGQR